jgi:hypothetical protein
LKNCFAECFTLALDKEAFAECFFFALIKETCLPSVFYLTLGKAFFAECRGFAECFLFGSRQSLLCQAPEKKCSAKPPALGKEADSGSGSARREKKKGEENREPRKKNKFVCITMNGFRLLLLCGLVVLYCCNLLLYQCMLGKALAGSSSKT